MQSLCMKRFVGIKQSDGIRKEREAARPMEPLGISHLGMGQLFDYPLNGVIPSDG